MTGTSARRPRIGEETAFLIVIVAAGVAIRLLWLARTPEELTGFAGGGEAARVALSLVRDGVFGDAFWDGSGPTAHLMPVTPAIAASVFRLFPPSSPGASLTLLAWCLVQSLGGYLLLRHLFVKLGADVRAIRWATIMLFTAAIYAPEETVGFRYWDGAAAVCLSAMNLLAALAVERSGRVSGKAAAGAAILWAATAFTSPVAGFALALVWGWVALRRLPMLQAVRFAAFSAVALAAFLAPWSARNARELGLPVMLRSNFGLEFAIGNHPAALTDRPPEDVYAARLAAIHPLYGAAGRGALLRAGGEVAYSRALGAQTWRWVAAHPLDFARLLGRHLLQFFVPPAWTLLLSTWEELMTPRAALIALMNLGGLISIAIGVWRRRPGSVLLAIFVTTVAAPYALVQPNPRYTYLVWGLLAFAAWDGAFRLIASRPGAANAR